MHDSRKKKQLEEEFPKYSKDECPVTKGKSPVMHDSRKKKQLEEEFPNYKKDDFPVLEQIKKDPPMCDLRKIKPFKEGPKKNENDAITENGKKDNSKFRRFKSKEQTFKLCDFNDAGINMFQFKSPSGIHRKWENVINSNNNDRRDLNYHQSNEAAKELQESKPQTLPINDSNGVSENFSCMKLNDFDGAGINCFKNNSNLASMKKEINQSKGLSSAERSNQIRQHFNENYRPYKPMTGFVAVKELTYEEMASRPQPIIDPEEAWDNDFLY